MRSRIVASLVVLVGALTAGGPALAQAQGTGSDPEALSYPYRVVPQDAIRGHLLEGPFKEPTGVFFDEVAGELFVADSKNGLIGIFNSEGTPVFTFGGSPSLHDLRQLVVLSDGTVLAVRPASTEVAVFSYRGEARPSLVFPGPDTSPDEFVPVRISAYCRDAEGRHVVANSDPPEILIYDSDLSLVRSILPQRGGAEFGIITGMAFSPEGLLAVVDFKATPVQIFDPRGEFVRGFGERDIAREDFSAPTGVDFDEEGFLYIVDTLRHEVKIFDVFGRYHGQFGGWFSPAAGGRAPGEMLYPAGVACGPGGLIYVAERFGNRVQIFKKIPVDPNARPRLRLPRGGSPTRR